MPALRLLALTAALGGTACSAAASPAAAAAAWQHGGSARAPTATASKPNLMSTASKPNLVFLLLDDWGWGNFNIHNNVSDVVTPHLDALANGGLVLDRHYAFKYCSPSRCALQSGRNPIHVNVLNDDIRSHNASDPWGVQGIPRNMTTIAAKVRVAREQQRRACCGVASPVRTAGG